MIVPAYVTSTQFLGNSSIFTQQLDYQKLPYTISSVMESLQKTGVLAVMNKEFKLLSEDNEQLISTLDQEHHHAIVQCSADTDGGTKYSLVKYDNGKDVGSMRLTFIPMQGVNFQASLAEVYSLLEINRKGAVYIFSTTEQIVGIITWKTLRHHLHKASY